MRKHNFFRIEQKNGGIRLESYREIVKQFTMTNIEFRSQIRTVGFLSWRREIITSLLVFIFRRKFVMNWMNGKGRKNRQQQQQQKSYATSFDVKWPFLIIKVSVVCHTHKLHSMTLQYMLRALYFPQFASCSTNSIFFSMKRGKFEMVYRRMRRRTNTRQIMIIY